MSFLKNCFVYNKKYEKMSLKYRKNKICNCLANKYVNNTNVDLDELKLKSNKGDKPIFNELKCNYPKLKVQYMSDLHLDKNGDLTTYNIPKTSANIIIIAGDTADGILGVEFAYRQSYLLDGKPIIYILGNHEYHYQNYYTLLSKVRAKESECKRYYKDTAQVYILDNQELFLKEYGVRILGTTLWSQVDVESQAVWSRVSDYSKVLISDIKDDDNVDDNVDVDVDGNADKSNKSLQFLNPKIILKKFKENCKWLKRKLKHPPLGTRHTIIVTHHSPHPVFSNYDFETSLASAYSTDMSRLFSKNMTWIFGHTHFVANTMLNGARLASNPRGALQPEIKFNPEKTVTI